jgi:two-component system CheB/CheR fusion protein
MPDIAESTDMSPPPIIVAVAASAVETDSIEEFFEHMDPSPGAAFVVIMHHRDSVDEEALVNRLAKVSGRTVLQAAKGKELASEQIYIVPAAATATLKNGRFDIRPAVEEPGHRGSIDSFLVSLAEQEQKRAIGITMAGAGTDGTLGLTAIREHGGLALAAQGPEDIDIERFAGQPKSAAAMADLLLPVEELAARVTTQIRSIRRQVLAENFEELVAQTGPQLTRIAAVLRNRTGHDFHGYKPNTFLRRVQRRMQVTKRTRSSITSIIFAAKQKKQPTSSMIC